MEVRKEEERVQVELKPSHFVLYGVIVDKNTNGIWLKTDEQTSFLSYDAIFLIRRIR